MREMRYDVFGRIVGRRRRAPDHLRSLRMARPAASA